MIEVHSESQSEPDPPERDGAGESSEEPRSPERQFGSIRELLEGDLDIATVFVEVKKLLGGRETSRILTELIRRKYENTTLELTESNNIFKGGLKGFISGYAARMRALPASARAEKLRDAAIFARNHALSEKPLVVWGRHRETRRLVATLLTMKPDPTVPNDKEPTPRDIAVTLSSFMRARLGYTLSEDVNEPAIAQLIKKGAKGDRGALAQRLLEGGMVSSGLEKYFGNEDELRDPIIQELLGGELFDARPLTQYAPEKEAAYQNEVRALLKVAREGKHEQSEVWRDNRACLFVAELLRADQSIESIAWAVKRFLDLDISKSGIDYKIYHETADKNPLTFAQSLVTRVEHNLTPSDLKGTRREIRRMHRLALLTIESRKIERIIDAQVTPEMVGDDVETVKRNITRFFFKARKSPESVLQTMRSAVSSADDLMKDLAIARELDDTIKEAIRPLPPGEAREKPLTMEHVYRFATRRFAQKSYALSEDACSVVFILKNITPRGVLTLVERGERSSRQDRSLDAPLTSEEGSSTLADVLGAADPGYERFETHDELQQVLSEARRGAVLTDEQITNFTRVLNGQDLEPEEYQALAEAIQSVPALLRILGREQDDE